ncbi:SGNH/GDSL hydrolase family protein [Massilia violaceinigra]|uniref:SGNH/GDSL hydrolase family protein n=1 Tax=Massilia violaceinigra TaxID=2045208 RepID=A0ABY4A7E7_9BURK|nr:hypothetical protein [Massilia violaceinigra]UOD30708.1 SGNH/GDSL hydrolase family protein [Massilia violaceinigra]
MTIRLLCAHAGYPANAIVALGTGTEAGLVAAKMATTELAGGISYVPAPTVAPVAAAVALDVSGRAKRFSMGSIKGAAKWFGSNIAGVTFGGLVAAASGYRATWGLTCVAEAPFYAVQLVYVNLTNNAITGLRAIAGVTETVATNVQANFCKPVINGATHGVMAPAGSVNGFFPLTWGGAATATVPASVTSSQIAISDILALNSVPRVDVPGGLHAAVFRIDHDPATGGKFSFVAASTAMRAATPENRGRVIQTFNYGADALTNPGLNLAWSSESHLIFPIFHYAVPSLTVVVASDSTGQNDQLVPSIFTSWGFRGCADASIPTRPVNYVNLGCSSKGAAEYWTRTQELVAAGIIPDVLVINPASVNDGYVIANLARIFADHRSRAMEIIRFARANGIANVCFIPLLPYNDLNAVQDGYRVAFNAWLGTVAGASVLSFPGLGDGAMPERWIPAMNHNLDKFHPSDFAIETVMARSLTAYLNTIV